MEGEIKMKKIKFLENDLTDVDDQNICYKYQRD